MQRGKFRNNQEITINEYRRRKEERIYAMLEKYEKSEIVSGKLRKGKEN